MGDGRFWDMILAQQTKLPIRYGTCIWCNRRFLSNGLERDQTVTFGPVERSEEHIIPSNIYGGIITLDLCKSCNERFGSVPTTICYVTRGCSPRPVELELRANSSSRGFVAARRWTMDGRLK